MKNRFHDALSEIRAEEQLKRSTAAFLKKKAYQKQEQTSFKRFAVALASFVVILFSGVFSYNLYFTESAYLDIDVNPSMELTLNRFDRVIDVHAYNEDGQRVLNAVDIRYKSYEDALAALIDKMIELGYVKDSDLFTATLQTKGGEVEKEKLDALRSSIDSILQTNNRTIEDNVFAVDSSTKAHSHEQNLTPAKYLAILELQKFDPSATFDNCRDHSISAIEQQIHRHRNGSGQGNGNAEGQSGGSGHEETPTKENDDVGAEHHEESEGAQPPSMSAPQNQSGEHGHRGDNGRGHD